MCYGVARGHTSYGLEMRTKNNKSFSANSTSVYVSSVSSATIKHLFAPEELLVNGGVTRTKIHVNISKTKTKKPPKLLE